MFYDLIQQDKLLFNTLAYGVQGTHWDWSDASKSSIKFIGDPANSGYNPGTSWAFGGNHQLDTYPIASETPQQKAALQASVKLQLSAKASVALGFVLDAGPIKSELAQIAAVLKQYRDPLMAGLVDPKVAVPDLNRRLQQAGLDRVMAETQRQINAWKKSQ